MLKIRYIKEYILCHNGKIYEYTAPQSYINESSYNIVIAKFEEKGYNNKSQLEAMRYLSKIYNFEFKEVK